MLVRFRPILVRHATSTRYLRSLLTDHELITVSSFKLPPRHYFSTEKNELTVQKPASMSTDQKKRVKRIVQILKDDIKRQKAEEEKREQLLQLEKALLPRPPLFSKERLVAIKNATVDALKHYYHGARLFWLELKLSLKYLWMYGKGHPLTRRERQQLVKSLRDVLKLVPFSVFVIVPFMEFTLPIFLKLFPNMLPSTFQETAKEEERIRNQLKIRNETAKFLQDVLEEIGKNRIKQTNQSLAYEFSQFVKKVRTEGSYVSNNDLFKFIKLFEDEFTLDNLSMSHLRGLCRLLGVGTIGTPEILRLNLHLKLNELKRDDRLIESEGGVDVLSSKELISACRARGMRAIGVSNERLKEQLKEWLELSRDDRVPPSLLLLSRSMFFPEEMTFEERLRVVLSNLPDEIVEETRQKLSEIEGTIVDPASRRELLRRIESALVEERKTEEAIEERAESSKKKIDIDSIESKLSEELDASEKAEALEEAVWELKEEEKKKKEKENSRKNNGKQDQEKNGSNKTAEKSDEGSPEELFDKDAEKNIAQKIIGLDKSEHKKPVETRI